MVKLLFIEAEGKRREKIKLGRDLPPKLHILYSIQYKKLALRLKDQLEQKSYKIEGFEQILGCSKIKLKATPLFIGSGRFHALQLALSTSKEVLIYDSGIIRKISKEEVSKLKRKEKAKFSRFLSSENIGLLFSIKPGQNKLEDSGKIKRNLENKFKNKKFYLFVSDLIKPEEMENFPIEFWINTGCPGIEFDNKDILNYEKINKKSIN